MTHVRIGALDHRLALEAPVRASDGGGGSSVSWSLVSEVWGSLTPVTGSEVFDAEGLKGRVTHEIIVRYRTGVTPQMRFRLGTRQFEIRSVVDTGEEHRTLRCLAEERLA
jgi:SPP1 family predicted phage head-tail adaptor